MKTRSTAGFRWFRLSAAVPLFDDPGACRDRECCWAMPWGQSTHLGRESLDFDCSRLEDRTICPWGDCEG